MKYLLGILLTIDLYATANEALRKLALESGLKPVPSNFELLMKTLDTNETVLSKAKITLGKKLFFEKELSLNRKISCATCHGFDKGGADARPTAVGHEKRQNPFHLNTPTVFNTAFSRYLFWNGRSGSLEDQAKGPMQAPFEMAITPKEAERRISKNKTYRALFRDAYGAGEIRFERIADAIAAYEKSIVTRGRFDDFLEGNLSALDPEEQEGLHLFITKSCVGCHDGMGLGGNALRKFPLVHHAAWSMARPDEIKALQSRYAEFLEELEAQKRYFREFKDDAGRLEYLESRMGKKAVGLLQNGFFHRVDQDKRLTVMTSRGCTACHDEKGGGVAQELARKILFPFENRGGFLGAKKPERYFRVPLLRNIVRTKPYFHNGAVEKLEDAVKFMARHQSRVEITDGEIDTMIRFFKAVDGKIVEYIK